jgi:hypothetical protein
VIIPRTTDIDWLHQSVELLTSGRYRHRREGKTVAYMSLLAGEVELGGPQNTYLYIGETTNFTDQVRSTFHRMAVRMTRPGAITRHTQNLVFVNEQQYFFYSIHQLIENPTVLRTLSIDRIFFDVDDSTQDKLDSGGKLSALFQQLLPQLAYRRGDVI